MQGSAYNAGAEQCDSTVATTVYARIGSRAFSALAEANVCLQCASPYNTNCGFSNCRLLPLQNGAGWHWELFKCTCAACETACSDTGVSAGVDIRQRLLERHRFNRLDYALGVDEDSLDTFRAHAVPVLLLKCADEKLAPQQSTLQAFLRTDAFIPNLWRHQVFCSFYKTAAFISGTELGRALFIEIVLDRLPVLALRYQITLPEILYDLDVASNSISYARALFFRTVVAYDAMTTIREQPVLRADATNLLLALQLFADTHLDLQIFCDAVSNWTDEYLEAPTISTVVHTEWGAALRSSDSFDARREAQRTMLSESVLLPPLIRYYPHPLRAIYGGELADMTPALIHGNIWTQVSNDIKSRYAEVIHMLLRKAMDHKCLVRNFHKMLCEYVGHQPALGEFITNILEVASLGNYEIASFRPLWTSRLATRRQFHWDRTDTQPWCTACHPSALTCAICDQLSLPRNSPEHENHRCSFCSLVYERRRFAFFAVKEFALYTFRAQGVVDDMLRRESTWRAHCKLTLDGIDDARRIVSHAFDRCDSWSGDSDVPITAERVATAIAESEAKIAAMHDCNKPTMRHQAKRTRFAEQLLAIFDTLYGKYVRSNTWTGFQEPCDILTAPARSDAGDPEVPPRDLWPGFYVCEIALAHLNGKRWCDQYTPEFVRSYAEFVDENFYDALPSLLPHIGISPDAFERIQHMYHSTTLRAIPDHRLAVLAQQLFHELPVDFFVLHWFFRCMDETAVVKTFALDADQRTAQDCALRLRYRIAPWESLPPAADDLFLCRAHVTVCAEVSPAVDFGVEFSQALLRDGSFMQIGSSVTTYGVINALYDVENRRLVCGRTPHSSFNSWEAQGRLVPQELQSRTGPVNSSITQDVHSIVAARTAARSCRSRPQLERRRILGHIVKVGDALHTLCVKCGVVCEWRDECLTTHGMTCGRETRIAERDRYTKIEQSLHRLSRPLLNAPPGDGFALIGFADPVRMPPPALGVRGDMFERTTTPLLDTISIATDVARVSASIPGGKNGASQLVRSEDDIGARIRFAQMRKQPGVRRRRDAAEHVPHRERHERRAPNHDDKEWEQLSSQERLFRWMPEGQLFMQNLMEAERLGNSVEAEQVRRLLLVQEATRIGELERDKFFDQQMQRADGAERAYLSRRQDIQRIDAEAMDDFDVVELRELFLSCNLLIPAVEIVCAVCHAKCEQASHFVSVTLDNMNGRLMDGHLGKPLPERGLMRVFFCYKCYVAIEPLLRLNPVPLVEDVAMYFTARRQKQTDRALGFFGSNGRIKK